MVSILRGVKFYRVFLLCIICVVVVNLYINLFASFDEPSKNLKTHNPIVSTSGQSRHSPNVTRDAIVKIKAAIDGVPSFYRNLNISGTKYGHFVNFSHLILTGIKPQGLDEWSLAAQWVSKDSVYPADTTLIPHIIRSLEKRAITSADVLKKGTQLKLSLILQGGQRAAFKPKWYNIDEIIQGSVYSGKDRFNGEIAAFHLSRILKLNRAPLVTRRIINLKNEILPVATDELASTFLEKGNDTCFYGVCYYCDPSDAVCAKGSVLEGAVVLWLPKNVTLKKFKHPWRRSYSGTPAPWEIYDDYCTVARKGKNMRDVSRLLDLIEIAIFDFLIDNGDRHHYEQIGDDGKILLIDNGKSFGNPYVDHVDILAPLYQCCQIRKEFLYLLTQLQDGNLSRWLSRIQRSLNSAPWLVPAHQFALDRRLKTVLAAIAVCIREKVQLKPVKALQGICDNLGITA